MYAQRLGADRAAELNPFALLASQGVPLAFGSDSPVTGIDPWATVRAAVHHRTPGSGISARAAFSAATRGAWRAAGVRDGITGTLVPGAPASYAVWDAERSRGQRTGGRRAALVHRPRSRVPALPRLARRPVAAVPADGASGWHHPWLSPGRRREWARATDDTDIFPAVGDEDPAESSPTEDDDPTS